MTERKQYWHDADADEAPFQLKVNESLAGDEILTSQTEARARGFEDQLMRVADSALFNVDSDNDDKAQFTDGLRELIQAYTQKWRPPRRSGLLALNARVACHALGFLVLSDHIMLLQISKLLQPAVRAAMAKSVRALAVKHRGDTPRWLFLSAACYEHAHRDMFTAFGYYKRVNDRDSSDARVNIMALHRLGLCYLLGQGTSHDLGEAAASFRRAYDRGHADSAAYYGTLIEYGARASHSPQKLFQSCAQTNLGTGLVAPSAAGWYARGRLYQSNTLRAQAQSEDAVACFQRSARMGCVLGMEALAAALKAKDDLKAAYRWRLRAAEAGYVVSMMNVAAALANGDGPEQDAGAAFAWYLRAAEAGDGDAQRDVGLSYRDGWGTDVDEEKALLWLKRAAHSGVSDGGQAAWAVSELLAAAEEPDAAESVRYGVLAAKAGHAQARSRHPKWKEHGASEGKTAAKPARASGFVPPAS